MKREATALPEFQQAAVDLIVQRLRAKNAPRRFLLADEVGLGKTHVAGGVIDKLRGRGGLSVLYVASNAEIGHQNASRMGTDPVVLSVDRLTLLAKDLKAITKARRKRALQVFPVSPVTSFQVAGTGKAEERRLLLYLLFRIYGLKPHRYREVLRGRSDEDRWPGICSLRALKKDFGGIPRSLDAEVRRQWRRLTPARLSPKNALEKARHSDEGKGGLIGELRRGLALAVLRHLNIQLVVLDEFQRYRHELTPEKSKARSMVADELFSRRVPALLLSATPYRLYTTRSEEMEGKSHWNELLRVLQFLRDEPDGGAWTSAIGGDLAKVEGLLRRVASPGGKDKEAARHDLLNVKARLERALGSVMCRTERNWYLEPSDSAGQFPIKAEAPSEDALKQYLATRRAARGTGANAGQIADFWKSSPWFLSFMQSRYSIRQELRGRMSPLLLPKGKVPTAHAGHLKFEQLIGNVLPAGKTPTPVPLWIPPTYPLYQREAAAPDVRKNLVFSHWRFVPGVIAGLVSGVVEQRIRSKALHTKRVLPLRFEKGGPFTSFDLCFPDPLLAEIGDALSYAASGQVSRAELQSEVEATLREYLEGSNLPVRAGGERRPWRVAAWLAGRRQEGDTLEKIFEAWIKCSRDKSTARNFEKRYLNWVSESRESEKEPCPVSEDVVKKLARIALYSPAHAILRSLERAVGGRHNVSTATRARLLDLGLGSLRHYWNRPVNQAVIRRWNYRGHYTDKALDYCGAHQFEGVMNEYLYLLASSINSTKPDDRDAALLDSLGRVFALGSGSPSVRVKGGRDGKLLQLRSQFAAAFTDEDEGDSTDSVGDRKGAAQRRRSLREAFNSPFWPFVLATTSVGQEGLDFHLYCRDITHWNLPTNPVDLEQREGRINRRNGYAIRQSLAQDVKRSSLISAQVPLMQQAFDYLESKAPRHSHEKHGLYPHWIYEGRNPKAGAGIRRHLPFYASSADKARYERLRRRLSLYRLAFGQANQDDLLDDLERRADSELSKELAAYMINLAPFRGGAAWKSALREARRRLDDGSQSRAWLRRLLVDCEKKLKDEDKHLGPPGVAACGKVLDAVRKASAQLGRDGAPTERALAALVYFRNPFDDRFDIHREVGLADDAKRLVQVARGL